MYDNLKTCDCAVMAETYENSIAPGETVKLILSCNTETARAILKMVMQIKSFLFEEGDNGGEFPAPQCLNDEIKMQREFLQMAAKELDMILERLGAN